jgi:Trypsin
MIAMTRFVAVLFAILCIALPPFVEADTGTGTTGQPIVGGTPLTGYPEAVLVQSFDAQNGGSACSGALVAPRVVLTAGHCVDGFGSFQVVAPYSQSAPVMGIGSTFDYKGNGEVINPNEHDVGIVLLAAPINLASYPTVSSTPAPGGTQVTAIGRVRDGQVSSTELFMGSEVPVSDGSGAGFGFDYLSSPVTEMGDSGGPVVQSGTHLIVAVVSGGNGNQDLLARVDLVRDWIIQQIASSGSGIPPPSSPPPPPPSAPPSGIGACGDPGQTAALSVVVGCPEATARSSAGCRFSFTANPTSAFTLWKNIDNITADDVTEHDVNNTLTVLDTPTLWGQVTSSATIGSTVLILADKYVADADGNLPATPISQGNVVGRVQVGNCPGSNPTPGNKPPQPVLSCSTGVQALDLFPDDLDLYGHLGKLPTTCDVPAAAPGGSGNANGPPRFRREYGDDY